MAESIQTLQTGGDLSGSVLAPSVNSVNIGGTFSGQIVVSNSFGALTANTIAATSHVWLEKAGSFTVQQGAMVGQNSSNLAIVNGSNFTDVTVSADIALTANQSAALVARYSGPAARNIGFAGIQDNGNGLFTAFIKQDLNGTVTTLASATVASGTGNLRVVVKGAGLQLFLGNTLLLNATDTTLTSGGVGIEVSQGTTLSNLMGS